MGVLLFCVWEHLPLPRRVLPALVAPQSSFRIGSSIIHIISTIIDSIISCMLYSKRLQTPKTVGSSVVKMHTSGMGSTAGTLTLE